MLWTEVDVDLKSLISDDNYQNKLQDIFSEMTAIVYGGTSTFLLSMIYSSNQRQDWNEIQITTEILYA